ncbi:excinuclease ABC subunit C, partial [Lactobacillus sp. XV13L]|nr:excinuclease ABC subunit C [Lactobacillus sp. XV13L]
NALSSQLESIKGVGPKTRIKLLKNYGSVKKIKEAPVEELMKL